jgi:hypothetical protein
VVASRVDPDALSLQASINTQTNLCCVTTTMIPNTLDPRQRRPRRHFKAHLRSHRRNQVRGGYNAANKDMPIFAADDGKMLPVDGVIMSDGLQNHWFGSHSGMG